MIILNTVILLANLMCISNEASGQDFSDTIENKWIFNAYAEAYYSLDANDNKRLNISEFQYNHNRVNAPHINHGFIGIEHQSNKVRVNSSIQIGTYVKDNYNSEPKILRNVYTAYAGIRITKQKPIWIDAGIFPSYIGFESVNAFDNASLTRSLLAENSPYYLTGIRMNYPFYNGNEFNFYILTGWQKILPVKGNTLPSLGMQWINNINTENKFNWSFFIGTDHPDSERKMRYFNNLYWQHKKGRWSTTLGIDVGIEQKNKNSTQYNSWWSPVLIASYAIDEKLKIGARMEHYNDRSAVIIKMNNRNPMVGSGYSLNFDYLPKAFLLCRAEWRNLRATKEVFTSDIGYATKTSYLTLSVAYRFSERL